MALIEGKVDSLMDGVAQIMAKQENVPFEEMIDKMSKRASDYANDRIQSFLKEDSGNEGKK